MESLKKQYAELLAQAREEGFRVVIVPKSVLIDYAGSNPQFAKAVGLREPKHEIWIVRGMSLKDKVETLRHELYEEQYMRKRHSKYWPAHKAATRKE